MALPPKNEESDVLNRLTDIKPLISFTDREQFIN